MRMNHPFPLTADSNGSEVCRTVVFDIDTNHSYHLKRIMTVTFFIPTISDVCRIS